MPCSSTCRKLCVVALRVCLAPVGYGWVLNVVCSERSPLGSKCCRLWCECSIVLHMMCGVGRSLSLQALFSSYIILLYRKRISLLTCFFVVCCAGNIVCIQMDFLLFLHLMYFSTLDLVSLRVPIVGKQLSTNSPRCGCDIRWSCHDSSVGSLVTFWGQKGHHKHGQ